MSYSATISPKLNLPPSTLLQLSAHPSDTSHCLRPPSPTILVNSKFAFCPSTATGCGPDYRHVEGRGQVHDLLPPSQQQILRKVSAPLPVIPSICCPYMPRKSSAPCTGTVNQQQPIGSGPSFLHQQLLQHQSSSSALPPPPLSVTTAHLATTCLYATTTTPSTTTAPGAGGSGQMLQPGVHAHRPPASLCLLPALRRLLHFLILCFPNVRSIYLKLISNVVYLYIDSSILLVRPVTLWVCMRVYFILVQQHIP